MIAIATIGIATVNNLNAEERPASSEALVTYEIAAQDLGTAIKAYVSVSGAQVFFETTIAAGRRSAPVKGRFGAAQALKMLLTGTGLAASRTDVDAFLITPVSEESSTFSKSTILPGGHFLTALQTGVLDALCRDPQTRPGAYRVAIELWITAEGSVQQGSLIGSTGDAERDRALLRNLQGVSIAVPPPNMPQPFVMTIEHRAPGETGDCAG